MLVKSTVKYIQSLGQKKFRDEQASFIAEGPKIINELLGENNIPLLGVYAVPEWIVAQNEQLKHIDNNLIHEVKSSELERISFLTTPNQVLAIFKKPVFPEAMYQGLVLLLDSIQDPGNLGTIIRTADWFGVQQVICSPACADAFHPKVIQSTMGSIARVAVRYDDLKEVILQNPQLPVYGAFLEGENLGQAQFPRDIFLLIGNESRGISEELIPFVSDAITIPRKGRAESLNAAMATGILLSHILT